MKRLVQKEKGVSICFRYVATFSVRQNKSVHVYLQVNIICYSHITLQSLVSPFHSGTHTRTAGYTMEQPVILPNSNITQRIETGQPVT